MKELNKFQWIFYEKIKISEEDKKIFLLENEEVIIAYKTVRDIAIFTDKRIIIRDKQGITGRKIETYTIPYKSITMYSVENAGTLDFTSEVELWTKSGHIKLNFKRDFDINLVNRVIAKELLY